MRVFSVAGGFETTVVILGALPAGAAFLIGIGLALMLGMLLWEIHRASALGRTIVAIVLGRCGVQLIPIRVRRTGGRALPLASRAPPPSLSQPIRIGPDVPGRTLR